jgi:oxalate decarboxylase/phosphoglucose isomerase-like protein (cupin superfamily)
MIVSSPIWRQLTKERNMSEVIVTKKDQSKVWMEEQEVCREYYHTERITFGMSELLPGAVGGMDVGHSEADEVFYCVQGEVLCFVPEESRYIRVSVGDAMLVPPGKGHKLINIGTEKAILTWSCAPHP